MISIHAYNGLIYFARKLPREKGMCNISDYNTHTDLRHDFRRKKNPIIFGKLR